MTEDYAAGLRDLHQQLFGKKTDTPDPEPGPALSNYVPSEGGNPNPAPDDADMTMRRFLRRLLGADENYVSMNKPS